MNISSQERWHSVFDEWLEQAAAGDVLEYHRGFLALDLDETASKLLPGERSVLAATSAAAYRAAETGTVHLLQRRLASHSFSYFAVRRDSRSARPRQQV